MKDARTASAVIVGGECRVEVRPHEVIQTYHPRVSDDAIARRLAFQAHVGINFRTRKGRRFVYPNYGRDCLEEINDRISDATGQRLLDFALQLLPKLHGEVQRIHQHNVAHCDLKLENVLWNGTEARLIDFGAAVWIDTEGAAVTQKNGVDPREACRSIRGSILPDVICRQALLPPGHSTECPFAQDVTDHDKYAFGILMRIICTSISDATLKASSPQFAWLWSHALELTTTRERMLRAWDKFEAVSLA